MGEQGIFLTSLALTHTDHTLRLQKRGFLYEKGYLPGFILFFFTANKK